MSTNKDRSGEMPVGLKRLMGHLGPELLEVNRVRHSDEFAFSTNDPDALVRALVTTIGDPNSDDELATHAALMLGRGQELAPLGLVLPNLVPLLEADDKQARNRAAMVLEFAAPAAGNEDFDKAPSKPSESLQRIAKRFPELRKVVEHIAHDHLKQDSDESVSYPPRPA